MGPIITSQEASADELDISLLERLIERPLYAEHAEARHARRQLPLTGLPLHQTLAYTGFKPFVNLVKVSCSLSWFRFLASYPLVRTIVRIQLF